MPGSSEIIACKPATDADSNVLRWLGVAFATFALTIAMVVVKFPTPPLFAALLIGISYALIAARRLRVPAGTLLCPLALAAIVSVSGVAGDAGAPALVQSLAFALIGLQVGLRFTVAAVREAQALLPWVLGAIFVLIALSAGLGALLIPLAHVSYADAYLATTPGGLYAVLAASVGIGANTTFVVSVQVLRVLVMVIAAPPLVRIVTRWDSVQSG